MPNDQEDSNSKHDQNGQGYANSLGNGNKNQGTLSENVTHATFRAEYQHSHSNRLAQWHTTKIKETHHANTISSGGTGDRGCDAARGAVRDAVNILSLPAGGRASDVCGVRRVVTSRALDRADGTHRISAASASLHILDVAPVRRGAWDA